MNKKKVINKLKEKYPGKKIIAIPNDNPTEILCEVDPSLEHPDYSLAVAVIDKSEQHLHKKSKERYKIVKGKLSLFVDGTEHKLKEGEELVIEPNQLHWAEGNETWIECYSEPGWTLEDHITKDVKR